MSAATTERPLPWVSADHYRRGQLLQQCPECRLPVAIEQLSTPRLVVDGATTYLTADIRAVPAVHDCATELAAVRVAERAEGLANRDELTALNQRAA